MFAKIRGTSSARACRTVTSAPAAAGGGVSASSATTQLLLGGGDRLGYARRGRAAEAGARVDHVLEPERLVHVRADARVDGPHPLEAQVGEPDALVEGQRHEPAHHVMRLAERDAPTDEVVG